MGDEPSASFLASRFSPPSGAAREADPVSSLPGRSRVGSEPIHEPNALFVNRLEHAHGVFAPFDATRIVSNRPTRRIHVLRPERAFPPTELASTAGAEDNVLSHGG